MLPLAAGFIEIKPADTRVEAVRRLSRDGGSIPPGSTWNAGRQLSFANNAANNSLTLWPGDGIVRAMTFSSSSTGSKRGRKAEHYRTSDDEVINGLARRPSDGRWRIIGTDITFTEPDEKLAIHRFRVWPSQCRHWP